MSALYQLFTYFVDNRINHDFPFLQENVIGERGQVELKPLHQPCRSVLIPGWENELNIGKVQVRLGAVSIFYYRPTCF